MAWPELHQKVRPVLAPALLLCSAGLVANLHAYATGVSPAPLLRQLEPVWSLAALLVPVLLFRQAIDARRAVTVLLLAGGLVAAYAILQHFTGIDLFRTPPLTREMAPGAQRFRAIGLFSHPLTFAYVYAFVFAFAVARALFPASSQDRWFGAGVAILVETALWMTGSRGGWAVSLAGSLLVVAFRRPPLPMGGSGRTALFVAVAPVLLLLAPPALLLTGSPALQARAMQSLEPDNQRPRLLFWEVGLEQAGSSPLLGIGSGNFRAVVGPSIRKAAPDISPPAHAHQTYLQLWVESGALALAGFLWLCARWFRMAREWLRIARAGAGSAVDPDQALVLGALAGIVSFMLGGLTQDTLGDAEVQRTLAFSAAVLVTVTRADSVKVERSDALQAGGV